MLARAHEVGHEAFNMDMNNMKKHIRSTKTKHANVRLLLGGFEYEMAIPDTKPLIPAFFSKTLRNDPLGLAVCLTPHGGSCCRCAADIRSVFT